MPKLDACNWCNATGPVGTFHIAGDKQACSACARKTVCESCKRDIRHAFSRPIGDCSGCSPNVPVNPWTIGPRIHNWCVTQLERAAGPVYQFVPPARRWSLTEMSDSAFKSWCRAELKKAAREKKEPAATPAKAPEILGRDLAEKMGQALARIDARQRAGMPAGFDPNAFVVVPSGPAL